MLGRTANLCLVLAALLPLATAPAFPATADAATPAAAPAATRPEAPLEQLDEIIVRGETLVKAIADAEDDFFKLYNKLNRDDDYDTSCVYLAFDPNSQIKSRTCIPGFVADAMADQVYYAEQCKPLQDAEGNQFSPPPCYTPPPPELVVLERSNAYARHLMTIIKSDPRLGQMAGHLDDLYFELTSVKQKYVKIKTDDLPEQTTRHELGPRAH
jgi:septum formation topological specificity factor MinE